jgi:hypothetical protein
MKGESTRGPSKKLPVEVFLEEPACATANESNNKMKAIK